MDCGDAISCGDLCGDPSPARAEERGGEKMSFVQCVYIRFEWIDKGTS